MPILFSTNAKQPGCWTMHSQHEYISLEPGTLSNGTSTVELSMRLDEIKSHQVNFVPKNQFWSNISKLFLDEVRRVGQWIIFCVLCTLTCFESMCTWTCPSLWRWRWDISHYQSRCRAWNLPTIGYWETYMLGLRMSGFSEQVDAASTLLLSDITYYNSVVMASF